MIIVIMKVNSTIVSRKRQDSRKCTRREKADNDMERMSARYFVGYIFGPFRQLNVRSSYNLNHGFMTSPFKPHNLPIA